MSDVAADIVKIVSPLAGTVCFLQTLGKLYDSFAIGAQTADSVSLSLQDAVNNVSIAQNAYCSRDIYLQLESSVIMLVNIHSAQKKLIHWLL